MSPSQPSAVISASQFLYEVAAGWEPPRCEDSEALAVNHLKDSEEKPFPELYSVGWAAEGRVVHMRRRRDQSGVGRWPLPFCDGGG